MAAGKSRKKSSRPRCGNSLPSQVALRPIQEEAAMSVLDDYLVDPRLSLLDKTRIQAQVLVPVMRALRAELGKEKADGIVRGALRDWSRQLFAAVGNGIEGSPRRKWAAMQGAYNDVTQGEVSFDILRKDEE